MKYYIKVLLIFQMLLLLTACQKTENPSLDTELQSESGEVSQTTAEYQEETSLTEPPSVENGQKTQHIQGQACEVNFSYHNGIEYSYEELLVNERYRSYAGGVRIDGLRDAGVQKKVNDRISREALALYERDLPPYRGIKTIVSGEENLIIRVDSYVQFNEANILSVLLRRSINTANYGYIAEDVVPLTFNLVTGEEITFSELFDDGYDYQTAVREYVRSSISEDRLYSLYNSWEAGEEYLFSLLKPFETISSTQKFILCSPDEVRLVLDYDTPEFDVGLEAKYLSVRPEYMPDGGEGFVFPYKYETWDESLYRDGFARKKSLKSGNDVQIRAWESDNPLFGKTFYGNGVNFRISLDQDIENRELAEQFEAVAAQAEMRFAEVIQELAMPMEQWYEVNYRYSTTKYGNCLVEREGYTFWGEEMLTDSRSAVYDTVTGRQLTLEDCFVREFDYKGAILSKFIDEYQELSESDLKDCLEEMEFDMYSDSFYITLKIKDELYNREAFITFKELGEENISLFKTGGMP